MPLCLRCGSSYTDLHWCKLASSSTHILYNVSFHFRYWSIIMKDVVMVDRRWRVHVTSLYYFCKFLWIYNYFRTLNFKVKTLLSLQQEFSQDDGQDLAADLRPATQLLWDQSAQLPAGRVEKKWWLVEHGARAAVWALLFGSWLINIHVFPVWNEWTAAFGRWQTATCPSISVLPSGYLRVPE